MSVSLAGSLALFGLGLVKSFEVVRHLTSVDLPALFIIVFLNFFLVKGVKHTARMTSVFVVIKLAVIALFIVLGITHIHAANYHPFLPFGFHGVLTGAAIVFFAYIGFDAVTTMSEECREPQRDVPRGVIGSLLVCTVLYLVVAAIMTGAMSYKLLGGSEVAAPMARVLNFLGYWWASPLISIGAIAGISSVLIVLLFGQSRIMMRMSRDGLIAPVFGKVHAKYRTPVWSILITGGVVAVMAGLLPISELAELSNIGTLAAFVLVCVGVIVLRKRDPNRPRKFRCPGMPWVPALGALMSFILMLGLPGLTWLRFVIWMAVGLVIYWLYGSRHSTLNRSAKDPGSCEPPGA
jgi:APA family basic amino acid/polyamine antiporter